MEKQVIVLIKGLETILRNFRKSPSRKYLRQTLIKKSKDARKIYEEILYILDDFEIHQQKYLLTEARRLFSGIKLFIDARLDTANGHLLKLKTISKIFSTLIKLYKKHKMATPKVDLKMGTSIVQVYDGNQAGLGSFIDSVMLFVDTVNTEFETATAAQKAAGTATLIRFIKTRLTGKARDAVGDNAQNIDDIINKLKTRCGTITSPDVFISKMNATKQVGDITKFTNEIENLALLLERAYINENIPVDVATTMATKQGVKALCSGVRNNETKLLLKAGQFTTLSSAIEKALENETTSSNHTAQIMYTAKRGQGYRGRGYTNSNYGQRGHNYNGNRGRYSNHRGRGNFQRNFQSHTQTYSNQNQRGRGHQRGSYRGNIQPRVYYVNTEQGLPPTQLQQQNTQQQPVQNQQIQQSQRVQQQNAQQHQQQHNFLGQIQRFIQ